MGDLTYNQEGGNSIPISVLAEGTRTMASIELKGRDSCKFSYGAVMESFELTISGDREKPLEKWKSAQVSASVASRTEEDLRELRDLGVKIPNPAEVKEYLRRYDDMLGLVSAVCRVARTECFPNGTQLSLELYHDPEIEDEYLTLYVRQEDYERDILKKIKAILSGYGDRLADKSGWFLVTTDFEPPI